MSIFNFAVIVSQHIYFKIYSNFDVQIFMHKYLDAGRDMVASFQYGARCPCGYCHIEDMESHKKDDHMESFFLAETDGYRDILKMADNFSACESTCLYTSQFSGLLLYMSCSSLRRTNQLGKFKGWIGLARAFCAAKSEQTPKLTEPRPPQLQTELRARPPKVKSSQELELEELVKAPKIKARPLNKKILESKGDIGLFSHPKPQITTPQEFHFATDDRLGQPALVVELFDKLSLHSETSSVHWKGEVPRITVLNPFHLHTEASRT